MEVRIDPQKLDPFIPTYIVSKELCALYRPLSNRIDLFTKDMKHINTRCPGKEEMDAHIKTAEMRGSLMFTKQIRTYDYNLKTNKSEKKEEININPLEGIAECKMDVDGNLVDND